jgi:MoxR-like ATPase
MRRSGSEVVEVDSKQAKRLPDETLKTIGNVVSACQKTVVGKTEVVEGLFVGLLSEGHILLEGVPGVAKTTLAKSFSDAIGLGFRRVQGTVDTLPSDIVGTYIFDPSKGSFKLQKGPVFTNILLIDEINRNSPKTNSALLEAMQEQHVTISGETMAIPRPFMIIATQSPIEFHGVFPLPEVLVDRFLLSFNVSYPSEDEEVLIARQVSSPNNENVEPALTKERLSELIELSKQVYMAAHVQSYIVGIVQRTRKISGVSLGASPRASIALSKAVRAAALLRGRMFVTPDDVKQYAPLVLRHRLVPSAVVGAPAMDDVVATILKETPIPERSG